MGAARGTVVRTAAALASVCLLLLAAAASASARLPAPALQYPANGATVQALPAFTWGGVRGAATYQFEFSADAKFTSAVNGFSPGPIGLQDTGVTDDKTIPNGTYYWRARAVTSLDHLGYWSPTRVLHKQWSLTPSLISPTGGATVAWPTSPLLLRWSPVTYATQYDVFIATDAAMSNLVLGSISGPATTQGTVYSLSNALPPGTYYWAVTPVDAEGNTGPRSAVQSFTWTWPSNTTTTTSNAASSVSTLTAPDLSWDSVPGAASYQVEINTSPAFPTGSKVCCGDTVLGTSLIPTPNLQNATTYYWRVRAVDPHADAGSWNNGSPFSQSFDQNPPTVTGLQVDDLNGNAITTPDPTTSTPIVSWNAVPGASSYEVQVIPYNPSAPGGVYCSPASSGTQSERVSTTYWTPAGRGGSNLGNGNWPGSEGGIAFQNSGAVCIGVAARRDDGDIQTDFTYLDGPNKPAFTYVTPTPQTGTLGSTPASAYILPAVAGTIPSEPRAPLFTWNPVPGANGYYVLVSRDANFTDVVDNGFVNGTAFASRNPLPDETSAYYWAVIPSADTGGGQINPLDQGLPEDNPQAFNKSSIPPTPVAPVGGQAVGSYPTFSWTPAEGAQNYSIQVAGDPSFSNPLQQQTTDATSFTAETMFPADRTLYWRVRANDDEGNGLNWSLIQTFTHSLPVPAPSSNNPTGGTAIPAFSWSPVPGAIAYNMHVDQADGTKRDFTVDAPVLAPSFWWGTGIWRWEVQAVFPDGVTGAYFSPEQQYVRTEPPPSAVVASEQGQRIIISWQPDSNAKQYQVQLSTTEGFGGTIDSDTTDNTSWIPQITAQQAAQTLYWRVAAVDQGGNVGAFTSGIFNVSHKKKPAACKRSKKKPHRCIKKKTKKKKKRK